jgi:alpha-tubulin suppressor-like RCC1 family protein
VRIVTRLRVAWALAGLASVLFACNAIVGVTDVRLGRLDGGDVADDDGDLGQDDGGGPPIDAAGLPEAQVALALGFNHTCARKKDGMVLCWGDNGAGEIGDGIPFDGSRPNVLVPQPVVGLNDAVAVGSGLSHTCAVRKGGSVVCWGYNFFGQLGDGTQTRSSTPVTVGGVNDAIAIAGGTSFTCALRSSGKVACWGANYSGQLGDGTKNDRPTAADVVGLTDAIGIATAEHHACAVVKGNTVKCWGKNDDGQLGTGDTAESLTPAAVASLTDVVQVVAASRFTCARQSTGKIYCWGANNLGQLGNGSPNDAANPSPLLNAVSDAIHVWTGYEHACAVRRNGGVACWGSAGEGQVGSGSVPPDSSIPKPTPVVGITGALAASTGGYHSCATTADGEVFCWGNNSTGELGTGDNQRAYAAVPTKNFP